MVKLSKSFTTFVLLACSALGVVADAGVHQATRRSLSITRDLTLEVFHPASTYETFGEGLENPARRSDDAGAFDLADAATSFITSYVRTTGEAPEVVFRKGYSEDHAHHAYLAQAHDDILFANTAANVVFNRDQKVAAFGSSFVSPSSIASSTPSVSVEDAITTAELALNGKFNNHPAKLEYIVKPDNTAVLTHVIQIENAETGAWYEAFVDAHENVVVSATNFVAEAAYQALPIWKRDPTEGFELLSNPQDLFASPLGWHSTASGSSSTNTGGNNVFTTVLTSQSSSDLTFDYKFDLTKAPGTAPNPNAARVNAFYVCNALHDITYRYGFTEAAANFQTNNFGKGGSGNDRVSVSVQDSSGTNNANFATPADGQSGRMRMYIWTTATPNRDGSIQNDILIHEYGHGISNRLTGGGTARCLQTTEAGGMGEGWSDALANWSAKTNGTISDFVMAPWAYNKAGGIRDYPYSTSETRNPLKYADLRTRTAVHAIGVVWANMLHNVYANLVTQYGYSANARTDPTGTGGNVIWMQLYIDSMKIQPCNPTFISARDAWIQADANRYGGRNACLIWKSFAARGLGVGATSTRTNVFTLPTACQ